MGQELKNLLISEFQLSGNNFDKGLKLLRDQAIKSASFNRTDKTKLNQLEKILNAVEKNGDNAVAELTRKFDGVKLSPKQFRISKKELQKAHKQTDAKLLISIKKAISNVRRYQSEIFLANNKKCSGSTGVKYTPIRRVGICVPGASAPLPSTVIMTAVPAQVAGVKEIAIVSPPRYKGTIHPVILAVCCELGIDEVYRIGGAQAVAALAVGTKTISKADKIVGPGNQWVQAAKKHYFGSVDIDSIAGPSEVLIIANKNARPAWVAADMLSQAEHSPGSAVLFTDSQRLGESVLDELAKQLKQLGRSNETKQCLKKYSKIVVFKNIKSAIREANNFASEHLQIQCGKESRAIADKIFNAGAIFIGEYSPVAVGDYWAGPSHTLPTGTSAKFFSPLSSNDFVKSISIIEYDKNKLAKNAKDIIRLAETEGLDAHAKSVKIRQQ